MKQPKYTNTIPELEAFLENWKQNAIKYYTNLRAERNEAMAKTYPINIDNLLAVRTIWGQKHYTEERANSIMAQYNAADESTRRHSFAQVQRNIDSHYHHLWTAKHTKSELAVLERGYNAKELELIITKEMDSRRAEFLCRVEEKAGDIRSAALHVGLDGSVNGVVVGSISRVSVETIMAGGWNIQCLHYRVLVKALK